MKPQRSAVFRGDSETPGQAEELYWDAVISVCVVSVEVLDSKISSPTERLKIGVCE